jgi:hypothetical protein
MNAINYKLFLLMELELPSELSDLFIGWIPEESRFDSRQGLKKFLFSTTYKPACQSKVEADY